MRASQKLKLIDLIGIEMGGRYDNQEIDHYLNQYGIDTPHSYNQFGDSKSAYAKGNLRAATDNILVEIAADLEISWGGSVANIPPKHWAESNHFRLFISHIAAEKDKATRLRDCLERYQISGFVAHQDIKPTLRWQAEIEKALRTMDAFLAMHTRGFSQSVWTQQEIGFAVAKGVKIISLKMGEDPTGFLSAQQALLRLNRKAEDIAKDVFELLLDDEQTSQRIMALDWSSKLPKRDDDIPF